MIPRSPGRERVRLQGRARGFSLVEVMVSLLAGVIVALGVIGVAHEASDTLHEEVRIASAENGLRLGIERLRADLQRAAYMSTANIQGDPMIARKIGGDNLSNVVGGSAAAPLIMQNLAGVHLYSEGAAVVATTPTTWQTPAVQPDAIDIGGNFSSTDEYAAYACGGPAPQPAPPALNPCSGPVMCLEMNTPAMWRIRNQPSPAAPTPAAALAALNAAFQPGGTGSTAQYFARITDASGHYQYVMTCAGAGNVISGSVAAGFQVNLAVTSTVLAPIDTGGQGGVAGISAGLVTISPLEVVHWDIQAASSLGANYLYGAVGTAATVDPKEFVLTRGYIDASSSTQAIDPGTLEVVAEYAVDLKFGFTVDQSNPTTTTPVGAYAAYPLYAYTVDDSAHNAAWAATGVGVGAPGVWGHSMKPNAPWAPATGVGLQGFPEPQRIRSVRARLAIRSPFADRALNITPPTAVGAYMYRYQIVPPASTNLLKYARVRESITEVTLSNQARYFW